MRKVGEAKEERLRNATNCRRNRLVHSWVYKKTGRSFHIRMANQIWEALSKSTWTLSGIIERQTGGEIFLKVLFHLFFLFFSFFSWTKLMKLGRNCNKSKEKPQLWVNFCGIFAHCCNSGSQIEGGIEGDTSHFDKSGWNFPEGMAHITAHGFLSHFLPISSPRNPTNFPTGSSCFSGIITANGPKGHQNLRRKPWSNVAGRRKASIRDPCPFKQGSISWFRHLIWKHITDFWAELLFSLSLLLNGMATTLHLMAFPPRGSCPDHQLINLLSNRSMSHRPLFWCNFHNI